MKKGVLTVVLNLGVLVSLFAQSTITPKLVKYVTQAPDGSVAMTIIDDSRGDTMKLESANSFYKYQILDTNTSEPLYTASNSGKECTIKKSRIGEGTYNLRLYTAKFVITSKITISASRQLANSLNKESVAMND